MSKPKSYNRLFPGSRFWPTSSGTGLSAQLGFTIIELLVSITVLSVIMSGMFAFLWSASKYWQTGQDTSDVTENARMGLNRMTRELKQATQIVAASDPGQTPFVQFKADFGDGNEVQDITYGYDSANKTVWRNSPDQVLMNHIDSVQFSYFGSDYRCDLPYGSGDGEVTWDELVAPECLGLGNHPYAKIVRIDISLTMSVGGSVPQVFIDQAWLRNKAV